MSKLTSEVDSLRSENARLQNRNGILEKVLELKEGKEGQPRQPAPQAGQPALLCTCIPAQPACVQLQCLCTLPSADGYAPQLWAALSGQHLAGLVAPVKPFSCSIQADSRWACRGACHPPGARAAACGSLLAALRIAVMGSATCLQASQGRTAWRPTQPCVRRLLQPST